MSIRDYENAIKGTIEFKNNKKLLINNNGKIDELVKVKNFYIRVNKLYVELDNTSNVKRAEFVIKTSTQINEIKASIYGVGEKEGCYLTTACTTHRGLSDDCYELTVLRKFRDEFLLSSTEFKDYIQEYYNISPEIVKAIDGDHEMLDEIYSNLILPCVQMIEDQCHISAFKLYKDYTLKLKSEYLN